MMIGVQSLARRVKPFMLRRTKQQVVSELPPKTEIIQNIELLPEQRALYESIRMTMHERVQQEIRDKGLKTKPYCYFGCFVEVASGLL